MITVWLAIALTIASDARGVPTLQRVEYVPQKSMAECEAYRHSLALASVAPIERTDGTAHKPGLFMFCFDEAENNR